MRSRIALAAAAVAVACIVVSILVTSHLVSTPLEAGAAVPGRGGLPARAAPLGAILAGRRTRGDRLLTEWWLAAPATPASASPQSEPAASSPSPSPPPPSPAPASVVTAAPGAGSDWTSTTTPDWACIRLYESSDRFNTPTVPGGAYGFLESTWLSLGYSGWPYEAPYWLQSQAALYLYRELGWQPWSTRFVCGL